MKEKITISVEDFEQFQEQCKQDLFKEIHNNQEELAKKEAENIIT